LASRGNRPVKKEPLHGGIRSIKVIGLPNSQSVPTASIGGKFHADAPPHDSSEQMIEIASEFDGFLSCVSATPGRPARLRG
jgi:hypothetical protein